MVPFGLCSHEDKTFLTFWYKSKQQDASIEVKVVKKIFFSILKSLSFIILLNIIGLC